jgi:hypothetical protein
MIAVLVDKMIRTQIVDCAAVANWIFSSELSRDFTRYGPEFGAHIRDFMYPNSVFCFVFLAVLGFELSLMFARQVPNHLNHSTSLYPNS